MNKKSKIGFFTSENPPAVFINKQDLLDLLDEIDKETSNLSGSILRMGRKKVTDMIRKELKKCKRK